MIPLAAEKRGQVALTRERKRRANNRRGALSTAIVPYNANKLGSARRMAKRQKISTPAPGYLMPTSQNNGMVPVNVPANSKLIVNPETGQVEGALVGNVSYYPMGPKPKNTVAQRVLRAAGRVAKKPLNVVSGMYSAGLVSEARKKSERKRQLSVNPKVMRDIGILKRSIDKVEAAANKERSLVKANKIRKRVTVMKERLRGMIMKELNRSAGVKIPGNVNRTSSLTRLLKAIGFKK